MDADLQSDRKSKHTMNHMNNRGSPYDLTDTRIGSSSHITIKKIQGVLKIDGWMMDG